MSNLYIDTGKVFHTCHISAWESDAPQSDYLEDRARLYESHDMYTYILGTSASDQLMQASTAFGQVAFELSAYLQLDEVADPRAEKLSRLNAEYGWWDGHDTMRGFRSRGTTGPAYYLGHLYTYHSYKESFQCWKNGRVYQAHDRIQGEATS